MSDHTGATCPSLAGLCTHRHHSPASFALEAADDAGNSFRNFGRERAADRHDLYVGLDTPWATQVMFAKLMRRMAGLHKFKDGTDSSNARNFNPDIPAGYTYLAQFTAHDIIRNSSLLASLTSTEAGRRNLRARALLLDALYGEGPAFSPALYELPKKTEDFRTRLRTGAIASAPGAAASNGKITPPLETLRDIPRFRQFGLSDPEQKDGLPDLHIPDQRNDDNALVAQVTALFHHIHNAAVSALRALPAMPKFDNEAGPKDYHVFENARLVTTALYRGIVRNDLLKRLLAKPIWQRYEDNGFLPLADVQADGIPLEFSHAAYRLGHSMVRMSYVFNGLHPEGEGVRDALNNTSAKRSYKLPPSTHWIVDWSNFFEIGDKPPQPGRRIGPCFNDILITERDFPNAMVGPDDSGTLDPQDRAKLPDRDHSGLLLRDLVRGTVGGLLKLDVILKAIPKDILDASPLLSDDSSRSNALREWLQGSGVVFSQEELDHLSGNPPLILWLLFEAAEEADGRNLGTLASVIVGDVFAAQLAASQDQVEADPRTRDLLGLLFPQGSPRGMPELIMFAAKALGLEKANPPFVSLPTR